MPQSERSEIIKESLRWLQAKSKQGGALLLEFVSHIEAEVTVMGATRKRCLEYIKAMERAGLIRREGRRARIKITEEGKNWLQRKGA